jgi:glucose-1-phosphate cytidylyltransferase
VKVVIFAGGLGSRISEESHLKPKPMIEIGGKPILWHIMKLYQAQGFQEFIICLGYKGYVIKEYFANYFLHNADVTIDLSNNQLEVHKSKAENLKVTMVETGTKTMTAGRLKRVQSYIGNETFMLTYGDGLSDVDFGALLQFHQSHGKIATVTAIQPAGKFGVLQSTGDGLVTAFTEKPKGDGNWINGGFFVLEPAVFRYLEGNMDETMWEQAPMQKLVQDQQLVAFKHTGFWKAMDILRDKVELDKMWMENPPWKKW